MLAHELVVRPTQDLDLFTPVSSEVDPLVAALAEALLGQDAQVEVDRRGSGFSRLTVQTVDGRQVAVEIAHDARLRDSVQLDFGRVLHPDEVAADKTLALFGRAAASISTARRARASASANPLPLVARRNARLLSPAT